MPRARARRQHGASARHGAARHGAVGGLGVTLSVADVARVAEGTLLIALEAVATFNNPADATGDPTEHRRLVLAVAETRAAVVADTQPPGPFQGYQAHHWYFGAPAQGDDEVVATAGGDSMRWRFDAGSWTLVPLSTRPPGPEKVRRSR